MSQDKELEIQLQFLDEAQEYLDTLEDALIGLSSSGVHIDKINSALRSAHSIKGGAAMMGFQTLSQLAHRLEDSFKVLKIQKNTIEVDAELEGLLLAGVNGLRQITESNRQQIAIDPAWLETQVSPVFDQLHDRLGDPEAEDAQSMLSPEDGQDILPLLFQTEVEGCLQRLEAVMASHDPCLREEVEILAQELGGLGEMLQLSAFSQLCESVTHSLNTHPDRVADIAQMALDAWRRSQALILTGHLDALPDGIEGHWPEPDTSSPVGEPIIEAEAADPIPDLTDLAFMEWPEIPAPDLIAEEATATPTAEEHPIPTVFLESEQDWAAETAAQDSEYEVTPEITSGTAATPESAEPPVEEPLILRPVQETPVNDPPKTRRTAEFQVTNLDSPTAKDAGENTVRVPVKSLDQLNDLFSELTIERNGLDLHVKRLRNLLRSLIHRVQVLEQSNAQLRDSYDRGYNQSPWQLSDFKSELKLLPFEHAAFPENESDRAVHTSNLSNNLSKFDVLEMDRYGDLHLLSQEMMETIVQIQEVTSDIDLSLDDTEQTAREINKTSRQLRTKLTQVRMRPLADITDRFPRALRELSLQYGKPVELKVHGENTLIDRNILEALNEPLMHLMRNAFDHGIEPPETRLVRGKPEQGVIEIRALHRNNRTIITIRDDGGGIPLEKIRSRARDMGLDEMLLAAASDEELLSLIFEPGFSTSDRVTDLSGRGVGMDVVRERLKQIQGQIKVDTEAGVGTTFTLSVPFTLSVARVLLVESNRLLLAFPVDTINEVLILPPEQIMSTAGSEVFNWQGSMVPLIQLSQWLSFNCPRQLEGLETPAAVNVPTVLMLTQGSQVLGLQIDRSWGEQEVAIRKVEGDLPMPPGFSNCTILGDGRVVPLVSVPELLRWIATCERTQTAPADHSPLLLPSFNGLRSTPTTYPEQQPTVLVVDDSINVRRLLALTLEKAGYQVAQAKDGQEALDKLAAGLHVQAVICDIEMPRLDGYGFLARIKSSPSFERIPVAMLTSRSGDKHRQLAMSLGATAYFSKPYNEQTLLQTLGQMVEVAPI